MPLVVPHLLTPKPKKAEALFHRMESMYEQGNKSAKPNIHTCCALINAFSYSGAYDRALPILYKLDSYKLKPNRIFYNSLLKTLAKSSVHSKAEKALNLMHVMKEQATTTTTTTKKQPRLFPDSITYNTVILCAAYTHGDSSEKKKALAIATNIFQEMMDSPKDRNLITTISYGVMILACGNLIPPSSKMKRLERVKQIVYLCCSHGNLSNEILHQIRRALPEEQWGIVLGGGNGNDVVVGGSEEDFGKDLSVKDVTVKTKKG